MKHFATLFDKNYLSRGIVLYNTLNSTGIEFNIYILCLDNITYDYFIKRKSEFNKVTPFLLSDLEAFDVELLNSKNTRRPVEYYFTLSPCWPLFLLKKLNIPHICTLDADICFYSSPESLFDYLNQFSIIITPHKFSPELMESEKYGEFNVSFQIFKNDDTGFSCLENWRTQCIEWCKDELDTENKRFADQLYLNSWPGTFKNKLKILDDNVSGIAPWNINKYEIKENSGKFLTKGEPLIYYHFHHFKIINKYLATNGFSPYKIRKNKHLINLYKYYWNEIDKINAKLSLSQDFSLRVNLKKRIILILIEERKVFIRCFEQLFIFNSRLIPKFIRNLLEKIYG